MPSDYAIVGAADKLAKAMDKQTQAIREQNGILRELVEATKASTETPLQVLEQMMADTPPDAPTDEDLRIFEDETGSDPEGADELPENERWRLQ